MRERLCATLRVDCQPEAGGPGFVLEMNVGLCPGQSGASASVCQSPLLLRLRIPNIAATLDTIITHASKAASSKSWLSGWLPNSRVCVRARVMAGNIRSPTGV
jgi:hypothetical protein